MDQDTALASKVREALQRLRYAIEEAQAAGLSIEVPELVHFYLTHGVASGGPLDWKIVRNH